MTRLSTDMTLARGGGQFDTEATEAFRPSFEQSEAIQTEPQLETVSRGRFALLAMTSRVAWKPSCLYFRGKSIRPSRRREVQPIK